MVGKYKRPDTPAVTDWQTFLEAPGNYHNTPATWSVYVSGLNIAHMLKEGGLPLYEELARKRSQMLYEYMDSTQGFYEN